MALNLSEIDAQLSQQTLPCLTTCAAALLLQQLAAGMRNVQRGLRRKSHFFLMNINNTSIGGQRKTTQGATPALRCPDCPRALGRSTMWAVHDWVSGLPEGARWLGPLCPTLCTADAHDSSPGAVTVAAIARNTASAD